jgi:3-oxoacyl-[acyl-carrier protein] reductase
MINRDSGRLEGKVAVVTGGSRGIGHATALALADAGARVIIHYGRSATEANALRDEIKGSGGQADTVSADLASPDGVTRLAEQVRKTTDGKLDVLVANAGISKAAPIENHTIEDFDNLFATNVRAPFFLVQQLLGLFGDGSSIVLVSSLAARFTAGGSAGVVSLPAYASTKGALDTLVKHFAALLGPQGIRVNAVAPGVIETDMSNFTRAPDWQLPGSSSTSSEFRMVFLPNIGT